MNQNFDIPDRINKDHKRTASSMKLSVNIIIYIIIILVVIAIIIFLSYQYIAPFGARIIYQFNTDKNIDKVSKIAGSEPSVNIQNNSKNTLTIPEQIIRNDIVTFNLKLLSKKIDGIWINLKFRGNPDELKIGVKGNLKDTYTYSMLYSKMLEDLKNAQLKNGILFWQKNKKYQDLSELAKSPPVNKQAQIALYNYDLSDLSTQINSQNTPKINKNLRGSHTLYIKVNKTPLLLTVFKQDANNYEGDDNLLMQINDRNDKKITEQVISDDGITGATGLMLSSQKGEIKIKNIKPGIYKIILKDMSKNADMKITSIEVNQPSLTFKPPLFIIDEKPVELWTNSKDIKVRTQHETGKQNIKLDSKYDLNVANIGQDLEFDLTKFDSKNATESAEKTTLLHKLEIPKNDLIIDGDGYFSFTKESLFNPEPFKKVDLSTLIDLNNVDYIIAKYNKVKSEGDWYIAQLYIDPGDIKIDGDKLYFSLESPGLAKQAFEFAINRLDVTVDKPGWFNENSKIKDPSSAEASADKQKSENDKSSSSPDMISQTKNLAIGIWDKIYNFFKGIWDFGANLAGQKTEVQDKSSKKETKPTHAPSPTPTPEISADVNIKVLNGSGETGAASLFADKLKEEGFTQEISTGNSPEQLITSIKYKKNEDDKSLDKTIKKITQLLEDNYKSVKLDTKATESGQLTIILGKNIKFTPTPASTETPTATPKKTITPTTTITPAYTPTPTPK